MDRVKTISLDDHNALAVREDGSLWIWGSNSEGQVGNGGTCAWGVICPQPVQILEHVVRCRKGTDECGSDFLNCIRDAAWAETFVNRGWTVEIRADASNGLSAQSVPDKGDKAPES